MSDSWEGSQAANVHKKIDNGYSQSRRYLIDKLRYDESLEDFRSIRNAILHSNEFSVGNRSFRFAEVIVQKQQE